MAMQILRWTIRILGIASFLAVVTLCFFFYQYFRFESRNEAFVIRFITDSADAPLGAGSYGDMTNEFIRQVESDQGKAARAQWRALGKLLEIKSIDIKHYRATKTAVHAEFTLTAEYQNGYAYITVNIQESESRPLINSIHLATVYNRIDKPRVTET